MRVGWLALGISTVFYWLAGFAFQFGALGFVSDHPDLAGLVRQWTWAPLDVAWGSQWGMIGLEGYMLRGPGACVMDDRQALSTVLARMPPVEAVAPLLESSSQQLDLTPADVFVAGWLGSSEPLVQAEPLEAQTPWAWSW